MSRIGKKAIVVPSGVIVTLDGQSVTVKGPKGQLAYAAPEEIEVAQSGGEISFSPREESQRANAMWGLSRTLVSNMVQGVTAGYEETLELVGVGYRAALKGRALSLSLGFSHDVDMTPPEGITFAVPRPVEIKISGVDKQAVGEVAAKIRRLRPPEPYKGKGVTLAAASSLESVEGAPEKGSNKSAAEAVGKLVAERAKAAGVTDVVFDRGGYLYHGRVKALADAAREAGLNF